MSPETGDETDFGAYEQSFQMLWPFSLRRQAWMFSCTSPTFTTLTGTGSDLFILWIDDTSWYTHQQ
jgi:hypothetical protein